jgi:group I intron endonuclease
MVYSVYKITNKASGKCYIGITKNFNIRLKQHFRTAYNENSKNYNTKFYRAIRKYGPHNFDYSIIYQSIHRLHIRDMEKFFILQENSYIKGYNSTLGGDGKGREVSHKTKLKLRKVLRGIKRNEQFKQKRREYMLSDKNPMLGSTHSLDVKKVLSKSKSEHNKKCCWYNNGEKNTFTDKFPGEGWCLGRINQKPTTKGRKWYNNGKENKLFSQDPGAGWFVGMLR